ASASAGMVVAAGNRGGALALDEDEVPQPLPVNDSTEIALSVMILRNRVFINKLLSLSFEKKLCIGSQEPTQGRVQSVSCAYCHRLRPTLAVVAGAQRKERCWCVSHRCH